MTIHLVRHARAGDRERWSAPDEARPLDRRGRAQAKAITGRLAAAPIEVVVSSPYVRCVETVEPLARRLGLVVGVDDRLAEGADAGHTVELCRSLERREAVLCTHGDVVVGLLEWIVRDGAEVDGPPELKKGSTWELEMTEGRFTRARYVPPQ